MFSAAVGSHCRGGPSFQTTDDTLSYQWFNSNLLFEVIEFDSSIAFKS